MHIINLYIKYAKSHSLRKNLWIMEISPFKTATWKHPWVRRPPGKKTPGCSRPQGKTKTTKTTSTGLLEESDPAPAGCDFVRDGRSMPPILADQTVCPGLGLLYSKCTQNTHRHDGNHTWRAASFLQEQMPSPWHWPLRHGVGQTQEDQTFFPFLRFCPTPPLPRQTNHLKLWAFFSFYCRWPSSYKICILWLYGISCNKDLNSETRSKNETNNASWHNIFQYGIILRCR